MSNTEQNRAVVPAASLHSYAFTLYRLESEMTSQDPDMQATVDLLDSLTRLQGISRFGVIGDEAEHCLEYFIENKADSATEIADIDLTRDEQTEIVGKVREWIERFEHYIETAVTDAPTTEIPPNQLLSGTHGLLAKHVGERYESEVRDLNEAANNLCAGSYTSAEFMCIRAVERILRRYFQAKIGDVEGRDWSHALDTVVESVGEDLPEELQTLRYLRQRRRYLVHPEKHSSREEAERTLMRTFKLVDQLIDDL